MIWLLAGPLLVLVCMFLIFPALVSTGDPSQLGTQVRSAVNLGKLRLAPILLPLCAP